MPRSNVRVVLRTRPCDSQQSHLQLDQASKTVTIIHGGKVSSGLPSSGDKAGPPQRYQFKFDGILHEASQEDVFELCAGDMVQQALEGYNGCIMCYGQTGAGKTFTMSGNTGSYEQRGLIPRTLAALLSSLRSAPGLSSWSLCLSYLEVYNDVLYDLLDINSSPSELTLYEDAAGQLQVAGARKVSVSSEAEALALFFDGETNRVIGQHQLNRESSRSHSVFIAHTTCVHDGGDGTATSSKLCLVDLAGSERVAKTRSEGLLLREAGAINKSLALLEQVVLAAAAVGRGAWQHVPYRTCKLTHVLKDCLGGNCATLLIANVWGEAAQLDETLSTCRFASRMAALEVDISRNTVGGAGGSASNARVRALEREVQELKEELAMMDLMTHLAAGQQQQLQPSQQQLAEDSSSVSGNLVNSNSSREDSKYAAFSLPQRQQLKQQALAWLQQPLQQPSAGGENGAQQLQQQELGGSLAPVPLHNVRQLRELLYAYRAIMQDVVRGRPFSCSSMGSGYTAATTAAAAGGGGGGWDTGSGRGPGGDDWSPQQQRQQQEQQQQRESDVVGEGEDPLDGQDHTALCAAPDHARPSSYGGLSSGSEAAANSHLSHSEGPGPGSLAAAGGYVAAASSSSAAVLSSGVAPDREAALALYRAGPGAGRAQVLNDNHGRLKAAKRKRQLLAEQLNGLKAELDDLVQQQEELKQQRLQKGAAAAAAMAAREQRPEQGQQQQQLSAALAAAQVLGPDEYRLVTVIREVKGQYREAHAELQLVREEVSYTAGLLDTCKAELAAGFEEWYAATYRQQAQGPHGSGFSLPASRPDSSFSILSASAGNSSSPGIGGAWHLAASHSSPPSAGSSAAGAVSPPRRVRVHSTPGGSPGQLALQQQQQQQQRQHTSSTPRLSGLVGGGLDSLAGSGSSSALPPTGSLLSMHHNSAGTGSGSISSTPCGSQFGSPYGSGRFSSLGGLVSSGGSIISGALHEPGGEAAAAFYEAQQAALALSRSGKQGVSSSMKKHRGERGTFSMAGRS